MNILFLECYYRFIFYLLFLPLLYSQINISPVSSYHSHWTCLSNCLMIRFTIISLFFSIRLSGPEYSGSSRFLRSLPDHLDWSPIKLKAAICPPKAQPVCGSVHAVNVMMLRLFGDKQVVCQHPIIKNISFLNSFFIGNSLFCYKFYPGGYNLFTKSRYLRKSLFQKKGTK